MAKNNIPNAKTAKAAKKAAKQAVILANKRKMATGMSKAEQNAVDTVAAKEAAELKRVQEVLLRIAQLNMY